MMKIVTQKMLAGQGLGDLLGFGRFRAPIQTAENGKTALARRT